MVSAAQPVNTVKDTVEETLKKHLYPGMKSTPLTCGLLYGICL